MAAGGALGRTVARIQDLMPHRKPVYRRVTPLSSRRETQRRAALAILTLVVVVGALGLGVYAFGSNAPQKAISSVNAGQKALDQAKADLAKVSGPGIDLIADDPSQALRLLTDAAQQLDTAEAAKVSGSVVSPLRAQAVAGLDRLYGVVPVASTPVFTFKTAADAAPVNLTALVRGPDGNPYVLDQTTKAVYRIGLKTPAATLVAKNGTKTKFGTVATPRFLAAAGQDLLILDSKNVLWRWRPADDTGKGTLTKVILNGSASLGNDIVNMNTWLKPGTQGLYNLYIVDPSEQQIRSYAPAADGSGFPAPNPAPWLAVTKDVSQMTSTYVDGDMFVSDGGAIVRYVTGKSEGWDPKAPKDTLLRAAPVYSIVAGGTARRQGNIFGYDKPNARVIALSKTDGTLPGAVPPRRRGERLVRPARHVHHPGLRRRAVHPRLAVDQRREPVDPRGRPRHDPDREPQSEREPGRGARARRRRPRSPRRSADRQSVIPLRDANPTRRTPLVTLSIVIACFVAFAWELGSDGERR